MPGLLKGSDGHGGEQQVRPLELAHRPAGQSLVGDDRAGVEIDDRLQHGAYVAGGELSNDVDTVKRRLKRQPNAARPDRTRQSGRADL